jgi:hypothetical protein
VGRLLVRFDWLKLNKLREYWRERKEKPAFEAGCGKLSVVFVIPLVLPERN